MSRETADDRSSHCHAPGTGTSLVFWFLMLMAMAVFAPCILLPEWRHYQALRVAEQAQWHRVETMRRTVERERRTLDAMRSDPAVIARLAQRELQFRRIEEKSIPVTVTAEVVMPESEPFEPKFVDLPPSLERAASILPAFDYDSLFCDSQNSRILKAMSVTLLAVALGVVARGRSRSQA